jgi:PAS domain S-box-containing protein
MNDPAPGINAKTALRVLFLEDDPEDVSLAGFQLRGAGFAVSQDVAADLDAFGKCLKTAVYDVIIADFRLPRCTGMDGFELARRIQDSTPFILVTGALGEEKAVECLRSGITDYVLKSNLDRLPLVVTRALRERDERLARKAAEEALRQSEERNRSLVENAAYGIARSSEPEDRYLMANPALVRMLGYGSEGELLKLKLSRDLHVRPEARIEARAGASASLEADLRRKDGSHITVRVSGHRVTDENGELTQWEMIAEDITEQKRAEARINHLTRLYAVLSQVNQACMRIRDRRTLFREVCRIAVEVGLYELVWFVGGTVRRPALPVAQFGDHNDWLESLRAAVVSKPDRFDHITRRIADGEHFICNDTLTDEHALRDAAEGLEYPHRAFAIFPLRVRDRTVSAVAFHKSESGFSDPTELALLDELAANVSFAIESMELYERRQRAEVALRHSRDRLRRLAAYLQSVREQERTAIAREIHDELGQMLTVLRLDVESLGTVISRNSKHGAEAGRRTAIILDHIDSTIRGVRRISSELRPGVLDHLGLMAAIEWQTEGFEKRTGIRCTIQPLDHDVHPDSKRSAALFRVFQESLTNISRHAQATEVSVSLQHSDGSLRLEVVDNGRGIEPDRIDDPNSLGLLGMKERAREFGGTFAIRSRPEGGTVVVVTVPASVGVSDPVRRIEPEISAAVGSEDSRSDLIRVFLADDHAIFRQGLREVLADALPGAVFGEAGSGNETLDALERGRWDLLVLDVSMPDRSGLSVLRSLRECGCATPVLMLSMHAERDYAEQARKAGAAGYLHKASPTGEILGAIHAVLAGGQSFADVPAPSTRSLMGK